MHQDFAGQLLCFNVSNELLSLLDHPLLIGLVRRRRDEHSTSLNVEEHKNEHVPQSGLRDYLLREKVALPHGRRVTFQELIPGAWATLRSRFVAVAFQDVLHSISSHRLDAKLLEFAKNPGVTPSGIFSEFQNQLLDILRGSRPSLVGLLLSLLARVFSDPSTDR